MSLKKPARFNMIPEIGEKKQLDLSEEKVQLFAV